MPFRSATVAIAVIAVAAATAAGVRSQPTETAALTVHEWGTFTSIAGEDGQALQWLPQGGVSDLPCFVQRSLFNIKGSLSGTVRMETPVLYFYAPADVTVNVKVGFKQGVITEWYPRALVGMNSAQRPDFEGTIAWPGVRVAPSLPPAFPLEPGRSHYYMARATDASPVRVGRQTEKFLFYRGVGMFPPPISAKVDAAGTAVVWSSPNQAIGDVILFENRSGAVSYSVQHASSGRLTLDGQLVVSQGGRGDGRDVERFVVRRRRAPLLHRPARRGRRHRAADDHAGTCRDRARVRRPDGARDAGDAP
jgi:hypothetical protein